MRRYSADFREWLPPILDWVGSEPRPPRLQVQAGGMYFMSRVTFGALTPFWNMTGRGNGALILSLTFKCFPIRRWV